MQGFILTVLAVAWGIWGEKNEKKTLYDQSWSLSTKNKPNKMERKLD